MTACMCLTPCTCLRTVSGSRRSTSREGSSELPSCVTLSSMSVRSVVARCSPSQRCCSNCHACVSSCRISQRRSESPGTCWLRSKEAMLGSTRYSALPAGVAAIDGSNVSTGSYWPSTRRDISPSAVAADSGRVSRSFSTGASRRCSMAMLTSMKPRRSSARKRGYVSSGNSVTSTSSGASSAAMAS